MRRAQTRRLHRARLGAVRRLLPDLRRRLVQPGMRGARMGAISARQAITRSSTRWRARLRPRQPARPTSAESRNQTPQAAATLTDASMGSTSTMPRSAPANPASASPARGCCAPVWPVLARPAEAPQGSIGYSRVLWGLKEALDAAHGWMLTASATGLYSRCGYSTDRKGYSQGTDDVHHFVRAWSTARG
jgi:hypothetical protein